MDERLRRSLLYVPASSEPMLRKAGSRAVRVMVVAPHQLTPWARVNGTQVTCPAATGDQGRREHLR